MIVEDKIDGRTEEEKEVFVEIGYGNLLENMVECGAEKFGLANGFATCVTAIVKPGRVTMSTFLAFTCLVVNQDAISQAQK